MRRVILSILALFVSTPLLHAARQPSKTQPAASLLVAANPSPMPAPSASPAPVANRDVPERSAILALANAFANDGFKIRDSYFFDTLHPKQPKLLRLPLVAPNAYWIIAASTPGTKLAISVFDAEGRRVKTDSYSGNAAVAVGFRAEKNSGYILHIEETKGKAADFCLTYAYK